MFQKILVANRGEIAVRGFRAATELGARTVAVFPYEDRKAEHRVKADESYQIGQVGQPVSAYLSIDEIIRAAKLAGADAVYPGYGFLSENADFAQACRDNGLAFIGPSPEVIRVAGDKVRAKQVAERAGIPVANSSDPGTDVETLVAQAEQIGFPVFVKAVAGGGGRGMRLVESREALPSALEAAMSEAKGAFGDPTVFIEQAVQRPRHIEVQVLGDEQGNIVHLYERDCSIQRRHQKVIEMAPARNLDPELRDRLCQDAVRFARELGYSCAGTVEFLVETSGPRKGEHIFIEMNPRIQVEHTVTEEVTNVDLVQAQMRIASGQSLADLGLSQDEIQVRGFALQARITTEDPANGFRPDTGTITGYRSASGAGIRLDGGTVGPGVEVSGHFDSLLVKVTARGRDFETALHREQRALSEFRVRGITTNIAFVQRVLADPDFQAGNTSTHFIDERPELMTYEPSADRGTKMLRWVADVSVNQPNGEPLTTLDPSEKLPVVDLDQAPPAGSKQRLDELGPQGFAAWLRGSDKVEVTDTTFRDAHQSLLATRVRTRDLLSVAPAIARLTPQLLSVECWGGATYDVALRFLGEDPWERLDKLREAMPNLALQMLLRGRNTVGYTPYPVEVTRAFVHEAAGRGIDIFRIFDALNDVDQLRPAIDAVLETGTAVAEVAMCYTGDLLDPSEKLYNLDFYLRLAEQMVDAGAHVLAIKDMAGLLRPPAAHRLVSALRENFDLPVHLHTHDTAGGQTATLLRAIDAGVDAVDVASAPMAGTTSQPPASALVNALQHDTRSTRLDPAAVEDIEPYWEAVRKVYHPFESGLASPTGRVYRHEIPGGQLSNLRQQAIALGLGDRFEQIEDMYAAASTMLGRPTKVTPSSKVVGDLALALVAVDADPAQFEADPQRFDIPDSVIGFLNGELGTPAGGWPEPFRSRALAGRHQPVRITEVEPSDLEALQQPGRQRQLTLNRLLFPGPTKDFEASRDEFGDLSNLPTITYLYGIRQGEEHIFELDKGVSLLASVEAISEPDKKGERNVLCILNGQMRPMRVRDHSAESRVTSAEKADASVPGQVPAPYSGAVTIKVNAGDKVAEGDPIGVIEAMKMEAAINAPVSGTVERVVVTGSTTVEGGDLLLVIG